MSRLQVESEIYSDSQIKTIKTLENSNALLTVRFNYQPCTEVSTDDDGDLIIPRKEEYSLEIEVSKSTTIPLVGLQLWLGAFVLGDFVLHHGQSKFLGKTVLELGAGVGLTSLAASMFAREVIATDISSGGILEVIQRNFNRNKRLVKSQVSVTPLNFYDEVWSEEVLSKVKKADIILAADVIYDNDLSEAFVEALTKILKLGRKTAYVALEKRYVFSAVDLEQCAPCYEYFLDYIRQLLSDPPMSSWTMKQISIDFPQFFDYERSKHVVLWEISS